MALAACLKAATRLDADASFSTIASPIACPVASRVVYPGDGVLVKSCRASCGSTLPAKARLGSLSSFVVAVVKKIPRKAVSIDPDRAVAHLFLAALFDALVTRIQGSLALGLVSQVFACLFVWIVLHVSRCLAFVSLATTSCISCVYARAYRHASSPSKPCRPHRALSCPSWPT